VDKEKKIFKPCQQENGSTSKFVTYLPVDGGATSTVVADNASESSDDVSEKSWILRAEQDPMGHSIISMKKMLHPKLQVCDNDLRSIIDIFFLQNILFSTLKLKL
jgi:hypothetical protein